MSSCTMQVGTCLCRCRGGRRRQRRRQMRNAICLANVQQRRKGIASAAHYHLSIHPSHPSISADAAAKSTFFLYAYTTAFHLLLANIFCFLCCSPSRFRRNTIKYAYFLFVCGSAPLLLSFLPFAAAAVVLQITDSGSGRHIPGRHIPIGYQVVVMVVVAVVVVPVPGTHCFNVLN